MTTKINEDSVVVSLICIFIIVCMSIKFIDQFDYNDLTYLIFVIAAYVNYIIQKIREV